jgi:hypothetical protein
MELSFIVKQGWIVLFHEKLYSFRLMKKTATLQMVTVFCRSEPYPTNWLRLL